MKSIRIGNDIRIEWPIVPGDGVEGLAWLDLSVWVKPSAPTVDWHNYVEAPTLYRDWHTVMANGGLGQRPRGNWGDGKEHCTARGKSPSAGAAARLPFTVEGNKVVAYWRADRQFAVGDYDIVLFARKDRAGQGVCDQYRFVRLVAHSAQADLPCGGDESLEAVVAMQPVTLELSGLSAYEIAVIHGFKGTEEEWIESLKQPAEDAAEQAKKDIEQLKTELKDDIDTWKEKSGIGYVDIDDLDDFASADFSEMAPLATGEKTLRYIVTYTLGKNTRIVGILDMFLDDMNHVLTQVLMTHYIIDADGTMEGHRDDQWFTYTRSFNINAANLPDVEKGTWGKWSEAYRYTGQFTCMGMATPTTVPQKPITDREIYYIATEVGTYTNFLDSNESPLSLADGEVALFISDSRYNSVPGRKVYKKQTIVPGSYKTDITELSNAVWPLELNFTASPTLAEYTSGATQVTLNWRITRKGKPVIPDSISLTLNKEPAAPLGTNDTSAQISVTEKTNTFELVIKAGMLTAKRSVTVRRVLPMYFGFLPFETASSMDLADLLTKQAVKTSPAGTYTLECARDGKYLWLCVPDDMLINKVTLNGFDVPMEAAQDGSTSLGGYKCYRSSNTLVAGTYTFVIS